MPIDISALEKELKKKYGKDILTLGSEIITENRMVVPICPSIDSITGGIEEGGIIGIAGPPGCGKSTLALTIARNGMLPEYGDRPVFYIDAERRLRTKNLEGINGLDPEKVNVIRSSKEKNMSGEELCTVAINILKMYERAVLIIDSVSSLCPSAELGEAVSGSIRSTNPRILASFCRQAAGIVGPMNSIVVMIHHCIANTSGMGEQILVDGGNKAYFQSDIRIVTKGKPTTWVKDGKKIGQMSNWLALKTSIGAPQGEATTYIRYGYGIDEVVEIVNMSIELGIIEQGGAWFTLPFVKDDFKLQGQEKVNDYIRENPELIKVLQERVRELQ
jgi:RecA/RadA recombinase